MSFVEVVGGEIVRYSNVHLGFSLSYYLMDKKETANILDVTAFRRGSMESIAHDLDRMLP